jgi:hypothetical protein
MRESVGREILIIDHTSMGELPAAFEKKYKNTIVLFPRSVELRQYEELSHAKYAIHTETFPLVSPIKFDMFVSIFKRAYKVDASDIRIAIRLGLKAV